MKDSLEPNTWLRRVARLLWPGASRKRQNHLIAFGKSEQSGTDEPPTVAAPISEHPRGRAQPPATTVHFALGRSYLPNVTLSVGDLVRSSQFYRDGLGFEVMPSDALGPIVVMRSRGLYVSLMARADFLARTAPEFVSMVHGMSGVMFGCTVANEGEVETLLAKASAYGGRITKALHEYDHGEGHYGCVADPDGNIWQISWTPERN